MPYSDEIKRKALRLFMSHVPMSQIANREEMPSRQTLYSWRNSGELTDGVGWETYREEQETEVIRQSMDEDMDEWQRMAQDVDEVLNVTFKRMKAGQMSIKASDLKQLLSVKGQIEKKAREHEKSNWRREVAKEVVKSLANTFRGHMSQSDFDAALQAWREENPDISDTLQRKAEEAEGQ